jgi:putative MFS transporter
MLFFRRYWRATLFISGFWFCAVTPYFAIAAVVALAGAGLSQWLAPETRGLSLTEAAAGYSH